MKERIHSNDDGTEIILYSPPSNPEGKLNLGSQTAFGSHRCGWDYAIDSLLPLHNDEGITFDGFIDRTFNSIWNREGDGSTPYREPWIGFVHNPPDFPRWFPHNVTVDGIISSPCFEESLTHCRGLFTLSEHLAKHLRNKLGIEVSSHYFATEIPEVCFDFERFLANREKKILAIGWWLRKLLSISYLPLDASGPYRKWQISSSYKTINDTIRGLSRLEFVHTAPALGKLEERFRSNTEQVPYLSNKDYDIALSENIAFLDLHDSSANNIVVECIARGTPLLVNPVPAAVEYLGSEYPFYFDSLEEAAEKACDFDLVGRTSEYLLNCETRPKLSQEYFLQSVRESPVYRRL